MPFVMLRHLYHCREHKILFKMMQKLSKSVRWSWNYSSSKLQPPQHLIWEISTVFIRQSLATSGCMFSTSFSDVYCINCVCRFLAFSCWPSCAVSTPCPKPWMWHVWPSTSCSPCCQVCSQFVSDSFFFFFFFFSPLLCLSCCWSLLYSTILCSWADSLRSHVILQVNSFL